MTTRTLGTLRVRLAATGPTPPSRSRSSLGAGLLALAGLALAACGGNGDDQASRTSGGEPPIARTVSVVEREFELDPANPGLPGGGTVTFEVVNRGRVDHALEIETPSGDVKIRTIEPGRSQRLQAELAPGRYTWYCPIGNHRDLGMRGTITVDVEKAAPQPTPEDDEDQDRGGGVPGY